MIVARNDEIRLAHYARNDEIRLAHYVRNDGMNSGATLHIVTEVLCIA